MAILNYGDDGHELRKPKDRVSLHDQRQALMFEEALGICRCERDNLTTRERAFVNELSEGYAMVGLDLTITVKQFNWLRQIAWDLESP